MIPTESPKLTDRDARRREREHFMMAARHMSVGWNDDGSLDEFFVGLDPDLTIHAEEMDEGQWWIGLDAPNGRSWHINLWKKGRRWHARLDPQFHGADE